MFEDAVLGICLGNDSLGSGEISQRAQLFLTTPTLARFLKGTSSRTEDDLRVKNRSIQCPNLNDHGW